MVLRFFNMITLVTAVSAWLPATARKEKKIAQSWWLNTNLCSSSRRQKLHTSFSEPLSVCWWGFAAFEVAGTCARPQAGHARRRALPDSQFLMAGSLTCLHRHVTSSSSAGEASPLTLTTPK